MAKLIENEVKGIQLKEGQTVLDVEGNEYLIKKGAVLIETTFITESLERDEQIVIDVLQDFFSYMDKLGKKDSDYLNIFDGRIPNASDYVTVFDDRRISISAEGEFSFLFADYYEELGSEMINSRFEKALAKRGLSLEWYDPGTLVAYRD